ncbi:DUF6059 family protein [Streptomyces sp. H51]|uniref:DUF6059 family protein n=1 Tax=Streptomyces sp. H51 TaxID=3111770 RepID=UPI002D798837|nr:DUF6059 family protein [Streptomyces sp. H51]
MRLRFWLGRAGAVVMRHLLFQLNGLGVFFTGPLPGVHYADLGTDSDRALRKAPPEPPPGTAPGPPPGPPPGHPERHCATPPSPQERELWASLGIDTERTGN